MTTSQAANLIMAIVTAAALATTACVSINYHEADPSPAQGPVTNINVNKADEPENPEAAPPVPKLPPVIEAEPEVQTDEVPKIDLPTLARRIDAQEEEPEVQTAEPEVQTGEPLDRPLNDFMQTFTTPEIMQLLGVACDGVQAQPSDYVTIKRFTTLFDTGQQAMVLDELCVGK